VLLNHALQVWMALATVLSGGVGFNNFNTYVAPFCRGRTYQEIKQAIQGFIFNCNMSLIARGGQVLFSSIGVDMSIPEVLSDEPAISFGGVPMGVYGDYQEEADLVFRAICEVIDEKDYLNRPHRFPNVLFNIRDGDIDKYEGNCKILHDMAVNNPQVYFNNCKSLERSTMGCRSSLPMNYRGNYKEDCCNCGNFMYNTINLPLLALESENLKEFYTKLDYYCELTYKSLLHRKAQIEKVLYEIKMSKFLTQKDKITGEPLYDLHRNTFTIGYCGLNEALIVLTGNDIVEETDLGIEIIEFINQKKQEFFERDGLRWSVIASPAESTAHRFAEIIKQKYPDAPVQGRKDYYYLTNSSHIAVRDNSMFAEHIKNADKFHNLSLGGNILHLWMGEVWSDPEAYWSLNKKILETNTIFWAYSKCYTFCSECQFTINDKLEVCPICGSTKLQVWDRITGYFVPCSNYNNGKLQEFEDRFRHKVSE
ncbi:MAG: anaerobic ribonucleoside-triphosphate reductase, partial [Paludibacteraceae bacterium]|nr:anaerobic ribonucleoside-triphosphate reductase [Paludibacteraceae bacterium]